jgi:hypothetical protein
MATFAIKAGASFEVATPSEVSKILRETLISATLEYGRGKKFPNFSTSGTVANSAVTIGDSGSATDKIAPGDGFTWAVRRIVVVGLATNDVVGLYRNSVAPMNAIDSGVATTAAPWVFFTFGGRQLILHANERLIVANVGALTATGTISVSGQAEEVPSNMEWTL